MHKKRCRLSLLTNGALVNESKCGGRGGVAGSPPMSTAVHITWHGAQKIFRDLHPYLTYMCPLNPHLLSWKRRRYLRWKANSCTYCIQTERTENVSPKFIFFFFLLTARRPTQQFFNIMTKGIILSQWYFFYTHTKTKKKALYLYSSDTNFIRHKFYQTQTVSAKSLRPNLSQIIHIS